MILKNCSKRRISKETCEAVSAVLIYIMNEIMDGARNTANAVATKKISPKLINNAICKDVELNRIGHNWIIKSGNVKSNLLPHDVGRKSSY